MANWTKPEVLLPPGFGMYLCHFVDSAIETFPFSEKDIDSEGNLLSWWRDDVTHWMPLPDQPWSNFWRNTMTDRNMATFFVEPRLIEEALHMPKGYEIFGAELDFASRTVRLFVEGPGLPIVKPGEMIRSITPEVSTHYNPATRSREHKWKWGISS